jgi:peptide/nickel transport system substrate-binding protein
MGNVWILMLRKSRLRNPKRNFSWKKFLIWAAVSAVIISGIVLWRQFFIAHSQWIPASGGIFTESTVGSLKNFNPLAADTTLLDQDLQTLIFAGLLRHNPLTGQIEDNLATFRVSENRKEYQVTLKSSARFSNGDPVTLDDVLFTFEKVIQNPNFSNKVLKNAFEYIGIDVVDAQTIKFILPEPNVYFPGLLTTPILHAKSFTGALIEEITDTSFPANKHPIGAGPYVLNNIVPESDGLFRVFLGRNKHFFRGEPLIPQLVFYVYSSIETLEQEHTWTNMFSHLSTRDAENFEPKLFGEYTRREYVLPRFVSMFFNLDRPSVKNTFLRQSLQMSIDKERILAREIGWNRIDSIFFFEGVEDWQEPGYAEARQLLRDHGYHVPANEDVRYFDSKPVSLKMITSIAPPVYSRFAQNIVRTWRTELQIDVQLEVLDPTEFQLALRKRDYDIVLFGQNFSGNLDSLSTWHSSQSQELNLSNLTNPEVDFLIDEVRFSDSRSDLFSLNQKLGEIVPVIVLATPQYNLLVDHNLLGFSQNFGKIRQHAERFAEIQQWHFLKKRGWDWPEDESKFLGFFRWIFNIEDAKN